MPKDKMITEYDVAVKVGRKLCSLGWNITNKPKAEKLLADYASGLRTSDRCTYLMGKRGAKLVLLTRTVSKWTSVK